jgi:hypothetical protein
MADDGTQFEPGQWVVMNGKWGGADEHGWPKGLRCQIVERKNNGENWFIQHPHRDETRAFWCGYFEAAPLSKPTLVLNPKRKIRL